MNELDAGLRQVGEVVDAFRVALADENDERRLVDDAAVGRSLPVRRDEALLREALDVALDGEDGDVRADAREIWFVIVSEPAKEEMKLTSSPFSRFHFAAKPGSTAFSITSFMMEKA